MKKHVKKHIYTTHKRVEDPRFTFAIAAVTLTIGAGVFFTAMSFFLVMSIYPFGQSYVLSHIPWFSAGAALSAFLLSFALLEYYDLIPSIKLSRVFGFLLVFMVLSGVIFARIGAQVSAKSGRTFSLYSATRFPETISGRVVQITSMNSLTIQTTYGEMIKVYISDEVKTEKVTPAVGTNVSVAGFKRGGLMLAEAINIF